MNHLTANNDFHVVPRFILFPLYTLYLGVENSSATARLTKLSLHVRHPFPRAQNRKLFCRFILLDFQAFISYPSPLDLVTLGVWE